MSDRNSRWLNSMWAALAACAWAAAAQAQTADPLPLEVHTLASSSVAVPVEHDFAISVAGSYKVTLIDLNAQTAPVSSVKLVVTQGTSVVGTALTAAGSTTFNATTPGTYTLHVVGTPGATAGSGTIGMTVAAADGTQVAAFADVLALPSKPLPGAEVVTNARFTVSGSACQCKVRLHDLGFPQNLQTLILAVVDEGGAQIRASLDASATTETTVTLPVGNYRIFAVGVAASAEIGGLFSQSVVSTTDNAVLYQHTDPLGAVALVDTITLPAGSYTLALADLGFPSGSTLARLAAAVVLGGQSVAVQMVSGTSPAFNAVADSYSVYSIAAPPAGGVGSFTLKLQAAPAAPVLNLARSVVAADAQVSGFSFDAMLPAAGAYTATVTDFQFPAPLTTAGAALVQNGAIIGGALSSTGTINVTNATAGPVTLLMFGQGTGPGGLLGAELAPAAGGTPVLDVTQGVGSSFVARKLSILSAGNYAVTAADVGFPAPFANFDVVVTQGTTRVGSVFTNGTFVFPATPGNYTVNFLAQPAGTDQAGTYALQVAAAPPAPTLNFTSDRPSVASGGTVNLTWSTTDATSCVASGAWSGSQQTSGTFKSPALASASTFTLTCSGVSGTVNKSVSITIDAPSAGKSGGGRLDVTMLMLLGGVLLLTTRRKHFRA